MFAGTREAFVAQVALLLDMIDLDGKALYRKFLQEPGTCRAVGLETPLEEDFAQAVLVDAKRMMEEASDA